tara:strand:- start:834 stop:1037 length:204 start_codon:yes stop_codon:yes gene_type:complete
MRSGAENRVIACRSDLSEHASISSIFPADFDHAAPDYQRLLVSDSRVTDILPDSGFWLPSWQTGGPE